jgi:hypothetical protein
VPNAADVRICLATQRIPAAVRVFGRSQGRGSAAGSRDLSNLSALTLEGSIKDKGNI